MGGHIISVCNMSVKHMTEDRGALQTLSPIVNDYSATSKS